MLSHEILKIDAEKLKNATTGQSKKAYERRLREINDQEDVHRNKNHSAQGFDVNFLNNLRV